MYFKICRKKKVLNKKDEDDGKKYSWEQGEELTETVKEWNYLGMNLDE